MALSRLGSWGVRIPMASRLAKYSDSISIACRETILLSSDIGTRLAFDLREIHEIVAIVGSFDSSPTQEEMKRLSLLPKDHAHPDLGSSSRARDAQFELLLRAVFRRAGLSALVEEPDLRIKGEGLSFPIAAKRPGSKDRFDDRLRDGIRQATLEDGIGVVAISLDQSLRPREKMLSVHSTEEMSPAVRALVQDFARNREEEIRRRFLGSSLAAVLLCTALPCLVRGPSILGLGVGFCTLKPADCPPEVEAIGECVHSATDVFSYD